ncbi:MAG: hypothetical protein LWW74_06960 [Burkholderiales bacterium]|nr:hypothetical protein [Burkholderiales bacterium]
MNTLKKFLSIVAIGSSLLSTTSFGNEEKSFFQTPEINIFAKSLLLSYAHSFRILKPTKYECLYALASDNQYIAERLKLVSDNSNQVDVNNVSKLYDILHSAEGNEYLKHYLIYNQSQKLDEREHLKTGIPSEVITPKFQMFGNYFLHKLLFIDDEVLSKKFMILKPECQKNKIK